MTIKKTIRSLSFVLAASVSSIALAQGLGVAADAQVGVGSAPVAASPQAGGQTNVGANVGAQAGANPNSSLNNQTAIGSDTKGATSAAGSSQSGVTQAMESSGKSAVGTGLDTAAAAQASAHDTPIKIAKAKKTGHAKTSTKAKVDLDASTQLKPQNPN